MSKYEFKCIHEDESILTLATEQDGLPELLERFEDFLRGCGFQVRYGTLQIVEEEEDSNS